MPERKAPKRLWVAIDGWDECPWTYETQAEARRAVRNSADRDWHGPYRYDLHTPKPKPRGKR